MDSTVALDPKASSNPECFRSRRGTRWGAVLGVVPLLLGSLGAATLDVKETANYRSIKAAPEATPVVDSHDHLSPFGLIQGRVETERGFGMNLRSLWQSSYYTWFNPLSPWPKSGRFAEWWMTAQRDVSMDGVRSRAPGFRVSGIDG